MANLRAVTTTAVNLRERASAEARILRELPKGAQVEVQGNDGVWLLVDHAGQKGYVKSPFVRAEANGDERALWSTIVTSPALNVRAGPDAGAALRGTVHVGQTLEAVGVDVDWLRIRFGGQPAFVKAAYTRSDTMPAPARERWTPEEIAAERGRIMQEDNSDRRGDLFEALQARVAYQSQRDNAATTSNGTRIETPSGQMCNLTSLGMALAYLGIPNPDPSKQYEDALEHLRQKRGLPERTNVLGWGGVANALGAHYKMIGTGVTAGQEWWKDEVRPWLRAGQGAIMSIGGHIVRLQGVTEQGLVVDDPYGRCRLLPGEQGKWDYEANNVYGKRGETVGEDSLWRWEDVSRHTMRWIARVFMPAGRRGPDDQEQPPTPVFDDDGIVLEDAPAG